jgi:hypothetical protein
MEMPAPLNTTFDMVMDGTTTFMSADAFGPLLPGGDAEWIRFDAEELAEQSGIDVDQLTGGAGGSNPADILAGLEGISEDGIDEVGSEEVRGVDTTHYAGEIDMEAALQQLEDAGAEGVMDDEAMDRFQELYGDTAIPVDVWIDDDGLARRMSMVAPAAGEEVEITIEMFDYGEPVDIEVPDESDSVDFQELLGQLGGN